MRTIDADAALDALRRCQTYLYDARDPELKIKLSSAEAAINNLPSVQPELTDGQVIDYCAKKHYKIVSDDLYNLLSKPSQPEPQEGHWINGKCDLCGEHAPFWAMASTYHESNYCPCCGAKMKGGVG